MYGCDEHSPFFPFLIRKAETGSEYRKGGWGEETERTRKTERVGKKERRKEERRSEIWTWIVKGERVSQEG